MFNHLLAGCLIFFIYGKIAGFEPSWQYLSAGAFWGIFPDLVSFFLAEGFYSDKRAHEHRDNLSHSIIMPLLVLIWGSVFWQLIGDGTVFMVGLAWLSHPLLDMFGTGWGVRIFYPFSQNYYKLFYHGRFLTKWTPAEVDWLARTRGDDNWIWNTYFTRNWFGVLEWTSLFVTVAIILYSYLSR